MKYFIIILLPVLSFNARCQSLHIGATTVYTLTNQKVPMVHSSEDFQHTSNALTFTYEQYVEDKQYAYFASFMRFRGSTMIKFREGSVKADVGNGYLVGLGFSGSVKVNRLDIGMNYNLINNKRKFYLKPFAAFGVQFTGYNNVDIWNHAKPNGPEYFQTDDIWVEKFKILTVVPSVGLKTGFVFWKRLDVGMTFQGVYGYKSYQNLYFPYSYKGSPQETAVFQAKGTGLFWQINMGYRFKKKA